jgi:hypothetical protein
MKAQLESTSKIVTVNGVEARVWEGHTESGIAFHALIVRVGVEKTSDCSQFEAELKETRSPSPEVAAYPARMIL